MLMKIPTSWRDGFCCFWYLDWSSLKLPCWSGEDEVVDESANEDAFEYGGMS